MKKLKLYFIYRETPGMREWLNCTAIFENGWVFATHICSYPSYIKQDLWLRREERQAAIREMGIEVELHDELIKEDDLENQWPWLLEANKTCDQEKWAKDYVDAQNRLEQKEDGRFAMIKLECATDDESGEGKPG